MKIIVFAFLLLSVFKWFTYSMTAKGLLFYISKKYGEDQVPQGHELQEIIKSAIEMSVNDTFK